MRMIVVTPSSVGSFVVLTDGVLGNSNGIDILIQKTGSRRELPRGAADFLRTAKI
jgi:hypothetical protein